MPEAKLTVEIPEHLWIGDLSRRRPDVVFRVVASTTSEDEAVGLVRLLAPDPLSVIAGIEELTEDVGLELLWTQGEETLLQVQTPTPTLLGPVQRAGVPLSTPFDIRGGRAIWTLTTSRRRLSELRDHLEDAGIGVTIEYLRDVGESPATHLLTERQREALVTAVDAGYYWTPREATLGDVAAELEIADATCSELLHRAEGRVIHWFTSERANPPLRAAAAPPVSEIDSRDAVDGPD